MIFLSFPLDFGLDDTLVHHAEERALRFDELLKLGHRVTHLPTLHGAVPELLRAHGAVRFVRAHTADVQLGHLEKGRRVELAILYYIIYIYYLDLQTT